MRHFRFYIVLISAALTLFSCCKKQTPPDPPVNYYLSEFNSCDALLGLPRSTVEARLYSLGYFDDGNYYDGYKLYNKFPLSDHWQYQSIMAAYSKQDETAFYFRIDGYYYGPDTIPEMKYDQAIDFAQQMGPDIALSTGDTVPFTTCLFNRASATSFVYTYEDMMLRMNNYEGAEHNVLSLYGDGNLDEGDSRYLMNECLAGRACSFCYWFQDVVDDYSNMWSVKYAIIMSTKQYGGSR